MTLCAVVKWPVLCSTSDGGERAYHFMMDRTYAVVANSIHFYILQNPTSIQLPTLALVLYRPCRRPSDISDLHQRVGSMKSHQFAASYVGLSSHVPQALRIVRVYLVDIVDAAAAYSTNGTEVAGPQRSRTYLRPTPKQQ